MRRLVLIAIFLASLPIASGTRPLWIVWNIGQGSFSTLQQEGRCDHFDMGGEHLPRNFHRACPQIEQTASITHADVDHWGLVERTRKYICLNWAIPVPPDVSRKKRARFNRLSRCKEAALPFVVSWLATSMSPNAGTNEVGRWFQIWDQVLVTGDSPKSVELQQNPSENIRVLMLGHHGSRTSTAPKFLNRLVQLKIAISSARKAKYGHPHIETLWSLKKQGVPMLRTEDWGTLGIEMLPNPW